MDIATLISSVPQHVQIPTFLEMSERTNALRGSRHAAVRRVGRDRLGEVIDMISIGEGPRNILVIGAPHPNEPIGCVAIEWLIQRLVSDDDFRSRGGFRWHFIKAIEPYALKQNEGWFKQPDLATYLEHFYRPAMSEQAEYSFPLGGADGARVRNVPENDAYVQALRLTQPDMLVSLHNTENAGAFYFVSRDERDLAERLSLQPSTHGLPLNRVGELGLGDAVAPGVFLLNPVAPGLLRRDGMPLVSVTDFLAQRQRPPFELVPEVPLFKDLEGHVPSRDKMNVSDEETGRYIADLLTPLIDDLEGDATPLEALYVSAVRDCMSSVHELASSATATIAQAAHSDSHSDPVAHRRSAHLFALRPVAMTRRLAQMQASDSRPRSVRKMATAAEIAARNYLAQALRSPLFKDAIEPMPLQRTVAAQLDAILTCAVSIL